jgi:hypothetical protein
MTTYLDPSTHLSVHHSCHRHWGSWGVAFVHATRSSPARSRQHGRSERSERCVFESQRPKRSVRDGLEVRALVLSITRSRDEWVVKVKPSPCARKRALLLSGWLRIHERMTPRMSVRCTGVVDLIVETCRQRKVERSVPNEACKDDSEFCSSS